ncbi:hypothetical protein DB30_04149 [Enhygromyxa salina]|uniref:Uncharacterized protein n=1 Tax=Enhygromyxa salina TaxID=215803 RepID=A0A0C2D538_9BACT|nr:hypothetical protein [Enhygromyxa salina]KIG16805.1 hypothetical protein DB30_04149 [Enhygromyxa salina]
MSSAPVLPDWTVLVNRNTIAAMATAAASSLETTVYTSPSTHAALPRNSAAAIYTNK